MLPAISLVLMLLGEIARHGERLTRLEFSAPAGDGGGAVPREPHCRQDRPLAVRPKRLWQEQNQRAGTHTAAFSRTNRDNKA